MGWLQKEGLLFLPGNLQWKLVNSLHATTNLREKPFQRLLERSFRGTGLQMTIRQVVSNFQTIEAKPLPPGTSDKLAELIALTQALDLGKGKRVAIYTDFK